MINIFYSNPKDSQCNLFKDQVASIIDNQFLKSQNIVFKTTQTKQEISPMLKKYNIEGKCDLVLSSLKNEEIFQVLTLSSIHSKKDDTHPLLKLLSKYNRTPLYMDNKNVIPNSLLAWIWNFIFQNTHQFYVFCILFTLWCGIASAFSTLKQTKSLTLPFSFSQVIFSTAFGFLCMGNYYTVDKLDFGQAYLFGILSFILLLKMPLNSFDKFSNHSLSKDFGNFIVLCFPSMLFASAAFSFKLNSFIALIYMTSFFSSLLFIPRYQIFWRIKPIFLKITSISFLLLAFGFVALFGCKNFEDVKAIIFIALLFYAPALYYSRKFSLKEQ